MTDIPSLTPETEAGKRLLSEVSAWWPGHEALPGLLESMILAIEAEARSIGTPSKWHHSPDAPPEHFCEDCDTMRVERDWLLLHARPRDREVFNAARAALATPSPTPPDVPGYTIHETPEGGWEAPR